MIYYHWWYWAGKMYRYIWNVLLVSIFDILSFESVVSFIVKIYDVLFTLQGLIRFIYLYLSEILDSKADQKRFLFVPALVGSMRSELLDEGDIVDEKEIFWYNHIIILENCIGKILKW